MYPYATENAVPQDPVDVEALRAKVLRAVYAGAFSGTPAMIMDESRVRCADPDELLRLAREYGVR